MRLPAMLASALLVSGISVAAAQTVTEIVLSRQRDMKEISDATKAMAGMFKSPETYDARAFGNAAGLIADKAGSHLILNFSVVASAPGSSASASVSEDKAHFAELAESLKLYALALGAAARAHPGKMTEDMRMTASEPMEGGLLGTRPAEAVSAEHSFHLMLQTCASCHSRFRERH